METRLSAGSSVLNLVLVASCFVGMGCTEAPVVYGYQRLSIEEYQLRYSEFGEPWVGHQVDELIAERGPPDNVFEAKPRWSPSFKHGVHIDSYVYYNKMGSARTCIDTFVVVEESRRIIRYYCR